VAFALLAALAGAAPAIPVVTVSGPWVLPADARGQARAFVDVGSSVDATLEAVRSPLAPVQMMNGSRPVSSLPLPAGKVVAMQRGGAHLLLGPLRAPLRLGSAVPLVFVVRNAQGQAQEIPVQAEVRLRSALEDERRAHGGATRHGQPPR
jgi:copper(I)-binding protein